MGTGHTHTGMMSGHTNMAQPMGNGMANPGMGGTGLAHGVVGPTVRKSLALRSSLLSYALAANGPSHLPDACCQYRYYIS